MEPVSQVDVAATSSDASSQLTTEWALFVHQLQMKQTSGDYSNVVNKSCLEAKLFYW